MTTKKILLIEDEEADQLYVMRALKQIERFDSIVDAVMYLSHAQEAIVALKPDIILLDLNLPDSQGLDTVMDIQLSGYDIPIVVLTEFDEEIWGESAISAGAQDYLLKSEVSPRTLSRAIRYAEERHKLICSLRDAAQHDELTQLYSRRYFNERLETECLRAIRNSNPLSLICFDIDHFKRINDQHGHPSGDLVLKELSKRISQRARRYDVIARFGGEEFMVLLPETTLDEAVSFSCSLKQDIAGQPIKIVDGEIDVTCSFGVFTCDLCHGGSEAVIREVDKLLYQAKEGGRNCVYTKNGKVC